LARGASTPWKRVSGYRGGGTSAQSRAMHSTGVMMRQRDATSPTCVVGSGCKSGLECLRREQRCTKECKPSASSSDPDTCGAGWKCTMFVVNGVNAGASCTPN
jgi:hypothetical protein